MKKKYSNGDVYEGEGTLFTKKRNGQGEMRYANGDVYMGWIVRSNVCLKCVQKPLCAGT